jgi:hypothetical protein
MTHMQYLHACYGYPQASGCIKWTRWKFGWACMQAPSKTVRVLCMQEVTMGIYIIVPSPSTQRNFYPYQVFTWKEATSGETIARTPLLATKNLLASRNENRMWSF